MLVGRLEQTVTGSRFHLFQTPALADFFRCSIRRTCLITARQGYRPRQGDVEFDNINFSYDGKRPALVDFSLKAPQGTTVAFVGPTGAGKCTALSLLHRMWDAQSGVIRIDGMDIATSSWNRSAATSAWCSRIRCSPLDRRQSAHRQARRHPGRARGGRAARRGARLHHAPAQRLRHDGGRARHHPVGRRAPAAGDRPRAAQEPADPDPRRGDQRARRGDRGAHPEGVTR